MHLFQHFLSLSAFLALAVYAAPVADKTVSLDARNWADLDELDIRELEDFNRRGWGFRPQPSSARFKTATNTYSGTEVNKAGKKILKDAKEGKKTGGYPKPGSGFRKSEAKEDPTKGKGEAYHGPIKKSGSKEPGPGPDRVIVHKGPEKKKFKADVAYHDPKKPIPKGTGSTSHPFTAAKKKFSSKK